MDGKKVSDYMATEIVSIPPDYTVGQARQELINSEFHGLPVAEGDHIIGFVTAKELLRAIDRPDVKVRDIIRVGTITVTPDMDIDDASRVLFRYGLRNVPVVDTDGKAVGMLSNIDIIRSAIEKATPNKINMLKTFLEQKHGIKIAVKRRIIPIESLRPTQHEVYADELRGRQYEIRKGLVEPLIVIQKNSHYVLVDGHHRVLAARDMGVRQFQAFVLELDRDVELGMERSAEELGVRTLDDVKVIEGDHHPLVRVATRLMKDDEKVSSR
ncbi:CBS domain-containing ParB/RepB/Spo0J family partition protein [Methanomassiliicoccus luminyensis]|jgi:CBS domain-containing protein|uniref:CBS domain-containing ParB/RepB/Spo0J family partition protein n=1 Tax=Methanomassiliicoccus luminyensis TaxID=1080712 RepID=UPI00037A61BE|nr:CBS domain-containing protein [Methanomassiliicoccus luminyensis]